VDWADGQLPHPDERSTVAFYAPSIRWPEAGISPLDARESPLNPLWDVNRQERRSYTYGHFPLYLLVLMAHGLEALAPLASELGVAVPVVEFLQKASGVPGYALVGRALMAVADTFTVLLVFLLADWIYGRRRGRWWTGVLAAALSAFTVLQIQLSHFFAVDPISTTFTLLALYGAVRMAKPNSTSDRSGVLWAIVTGVGAGLAISSKFSALPILAAPVVAGLLLWVRGRTNGTSTSMPGGHPGARRPVLWLVAVALAVALVTFAATSPFAILDWENFQRAVLVEQGAMVRGEADFPFTRQYRGTIPYLYHIEQQIRWGMGWPLGVLAFAALAWVLIRTILAKALDGELIILSWIIPYFAITGLFLAKFMRYMVPITPLLMVFAAGLVAAVADQTLGRRASSPAASVDVSSEAVSDAQVYESDSQTEQLPSATSGRAVFRWLAVAMAAIALGGAILWSLAYVSGVYGQEHPFIRASRWMYENVPDDSVWITEHWEEGMPLVLPIPRGNPSARGWRNVVMPMYEEDSAAKFETLKQHMREGDYYVLATKRLYGALPNLPERYPMSIRFYDLLFSGQLGYELAAEFTSYPGLLGLSINDQEADESFWVYDHPRTLIYRKVRDLSDAEWEALLGDSWQGAKPWYVGEPTLIQRIWSLFSGEKDREITSREAEAGPGEAPDLLLDPPLDQQPVVQDFRWNGLASRSTALAIVVWWIAISLLGLVAWPITFALFSRLQDRGYLLARSLGWLLVGYGVWLGASLGVARNTLPVILIAIGATAVLSLAVAWRLRASIASFLRVHWRLLLFGEALFAVAYLFFVGIRILNPDLWQPWNGGEKFMEFAFLNSILRSANFPPIDPYFAGGTINYYYYGQYLVSLLTKLTGIWSSVAFNLAIPTLFAATVANVFCLGYNLAAGLGASDRSDQSAETTGPVMGSMLGSRRLRSGVGGGLLAALFVALLGNVDGGAQIVRGLAAQATTSFQSTLPGLETAVRAVDGFVQVLGPATLPSYRYWDPSRVIPYTINEFPYWSFLFADLHPHMIGIPFTVLFLALTYQLLSSFEACPANSEQRRGWRFWSHLLWSGLAGSGLHLALALVLGALAVINTWDLPTYFGLAVLAWLVGEWRSGRLSVTLWWALGRTALFGVGLLAASWVLYLPFFQNYVPIAASGLGFVQDRTELSLWLNVWGFLAFLGLTVLVVELRRYPKQRLPRDVFLLRWLRPVLNRFDHLPRLIHLMPNLSRNSLLVVGFAGLIAVLLVLLDRPVVAFLWLPMLAAALLLLRRTAPVESLYVTMLLFTGLLVLIGVEFVYLRDHLQGGDFRRMNTLFKFYIQVWVVLGLASAVALPSVWRYIQRHWHLGWRAAWIVGFVGLLVLSLAFPMVGTPARINDRFPAQDGRPPIGTLDGMAYMQQGVYRWHPDPNLAADTSIVLDYDYQALRWLLENVEGTPVVAEALVGYYREGGLRAATFTGFPTLLGFHQEGEQRYSWQTGRRRALAEEFWRTTDLDRAGQLIEELGVGLVYVGRLEQVVVPAEGLEKFERLVELGELEIPYSNDQVTIYRVTNGDV
jgi:YYY domain-containing protein